MNWDAISAIAGVVSVILFIIIEWDRLKLRFGIFSNFRFPNRNSTTDRNVRNSSSSTTTNTNKETFISDALWVVIGFGVIALIIGLVVPNAVTSALNGALFLGFIGLSFGVMYIVFEFHEVKNNPKEALSMLLFMPLIGIGVGLPIGYTNGLIVHYASNWMVFSWMPEIIRIEVIWFCIGAGLGIAFTIVFWLADKFETSNKRA